MDFVREAALLAKVVSDKLEDAKMKSFEYYMREIAVIPQGTFSGLPYVLSEKNIEFIKLIEKSDNLITMMYRGGAKSDFTTCHRSIHLAITEGSDTKIVCENEGQAKAHINNIMKALMKNPKMKRFIPENNTRRFISWKSDIITLVDNNVKIKHSYIDTKSGKEKYTYIPKQLGTIQGISYNSGKRGGRARNIVFDDIVTETTSSKPESRKLLATTIASKIVPMMNESGTRFYFNGTPQHPDDLLHQYINSGQFDTFILPVKDSKGNFTNQPGPDVLMAYKKKYGKVFVQDEEWYIRQVSRMSPNNSDQHENFQKEYYLKLPKKDDGFFKNSVLNKSKNYNRTMGVPIKKDGWVRVMGIDPQGHIDGLSKEKNSKHDNGTICIIDFNIENFKICVVNMTAVDNMKEWEHEVIHQAVYFDIDAIGYEGWGLSTLAQKNVLEKFQDRGDDFLIDSKAPNKEAAIRNLLSYFLADQIDIPYATDKDQEEVDKFFYELKNIGDKNVHDDRPDALVRAIDAAIIAKENYLNNKPIEIPSDFFRKFGMNQKDEKKKTPFIIGRR